MRLSLALLLVVGCSGARPPGTPTTPAPPPTPLAQLEASRDLDGAPIGHANGHATVIVVMASWCQPCRDELAVFDSLRAAHPRVRWLAVNYKFHEEYNDRGSSETIRALAAQMPWLRVVPADDPLFDAFGAPSKIPTVIVYDARGALAARYNRHERTPPTRDELDALLRRLP